MKRYDADHELKQVLDTYAHSAKHREQACALALGVIFRNCPAACAAQPQSDLEAPVSARREPDAK